ncbi:tetratricopeptide repeat protein [Nitrosospira sp. Nsp1]|uniref:tetratricopeptide repeat protein n=1 Tax=Nitrosospira sp. Nsp1 TaxID=136547 RepID=UPI0008871600|nr:tetratricopeptide repeat protein [Nitrosospira sp. Nsp1]SCX60252.1 hypothetical protein SAMN05720354_1252 [Nitrosospira sp. Nsp1]
MGLSRACRDLFNLADVCIDNDDIDKAKGLIEQAIALEPTNEAVLMRAVGRLVYAELYSSAREVFESFRDQARLEYLLGFTYEDIVQQERANLMVDDVPIFDLAMGPIRFKRLSGAERGNFVNYVTTSTPVEAIEISEEGLAFTQSGTQCAFRWDEITRASIVVRTIFKGLGVAGSNSSQKIFSIEASGRLFQFDVSSTYPDFREALLLRTLLSRYLDVEVIDERKPGFKATKDDPVRNLKRGDRIRQWLIVSAIALLILFSYMNAPAPG